LLRVDKGFDAERVMSAYVSLPASRYPELHQQTAFFDDLRQGVAALPEVRAAAYVNNLPLDGGVNGTVVIEGREFPPDAEPLSEKRIVSPGYFDVLRTPVLAGRSFDQRDRAGSPPVVIVNRAFAARFFPGDSALGKRVDFAWETEGMQEIVGVVEDVRERELHLPAAPTMYIPHAQRPEEDGFLVVRASGDPHLLVPAMRAALATLDGTLPLSEVRTLEAVLAEGLAERRLATSLFGVFSLVSLALAAIGLYAVISYTVLQRRQEIGIRMALGARGRQVIRTVLGQGLGLIAAGVALGALAALSLGRFLSALLFGVDAADPVTFGGVALLLIAIALLASIVPALRAARLDPASVLRSE
jgi:putative ABC transport system permease protein